MESLQLKHYNLVFCPFSYYFFSSYTVTFARTWVKSSLNALYRLLLSYHLNYMVHYGFYVAVQSLRIRIRLCRKIRYYVLSESTRSRSQSLKKTPCPAQIWDLNLLIQVWVFRPFLDLDPKLGLATVDCHKMICICKDWSYTEAGTQVFDMEGGRGV